MLERGQTVRQIEKKAKIKETKEEQKRNHILYKRIFIVQYQNYLFLYLHNPIPNTLF